MLETPQPNDASVAIQNLSYNAVFNAVKSDSIMVGLSSATAVSILLDAKAYGSLLQQGILRDGKILSLSHPKTLAWG